MISFWSAWKARWLEGRPPGRPVVPAEGLSRHLRRDVGLGGDAGAHYAFDATPAADSLQNRGPADIRVYCRLPAFR